MEQTSSMPCTRCGRAVSEIDPAHDGRGNLYCHDCIEKLTGHGVHPVLAAHACALCGDAFERSADAIRSKGNYCDDCVARLRGQRPRRKVVADRPIFSAVTADRSFEQMLDEIFSPGAGSGELAIAG